MNLRSLPKVELHRHLEGSVRFETFLEIAKEAKVELPPRRLYEVQKSDPRTLKSFLGKFALLRNLYPSRDCIERVAREAVEDAAKDGVIHLELRFSPVHFSRRMKCDPIRCAEWIINAARKAAPISLSFIITLGRDFGVETNRPSIDAALEHRTAIDIAGDEDAPLDPFLPDLKRARQAGLKLTLHAGEAKGPESVRAALAAGADRLGHGVRAVEDPSLLDEILDRNIAFEFCPTSNQHTGAWKNPKTHPLKRLLRDGHCVTINTDDPAISGIDLVHEYEVVGLTVDDLVRTSMHGVDAAFVDEKTKKALRERISAAAFPAPPAPRKISRRL